MEVVVDTTKVRFFKQITTGRLGDVLLKSLLLIPQRYDFSSKSQLVTLCSSDFSVVVDTTKVRFFKQITTPLVSDNIAYSLLLIPQRYDFSSKSQPWRGNKTLSSVVVDTTKVRFFKQITTMFIISFFLKLLLLIPQRYDFSSKSQHPHAYILHAPSCCWYHKGTIFQANHN